MVGVSGTQSGFTSLITAEALAGVRAGGRQLPEWEAFRGELMAGRVTFPSRQHPFLFAGGGFWGLGLGFGVWGLGLGFGVA